VGWEATFLLALLLFFLPHTLLPLLLLLSLFLLLLPSHPL